MRGKDRARSHAYAVGDVEHFWDGFGDPPDGYWPTPHTGVLIEHLISAYQAEGFKQCDGPEPGAGYEKVALYWKPHSRKWTHAAHLRDDGWWESKLGSLEDIIHRTAEGLEGKDYGKVALFMKRPTTDRIRFHLIRWLMKKKEGIGKPLPDVDARISRLRNPSPPI